MKRTEFNQLLAWTMLSALNSAVAERQNFLGRDLTDDEYKACHKTAHQNAELIRNELNQTRENSDTLHQR